jgi:hypothetical protein
MDINLVTIQEAMQCTYVRKSKMNLVEVTPNAADPGISWDKKNDQNQYLRTT